MTKVEQQDLAIALKHMGFDSVDDLHYWAKDGNELNRFDALCAMFSAHRVAAEAQLLDRMVERMGEALFALSDRLRASGFLDDDENHAAYEKVVSAFREGEQT